MDTSVKLTYITLAHRVMVAAGRRVKTKEDVEELSGWEETSVILPGSGTVKERKVNPGNVFHINNVCDLNSYGMPNGGNSYHQKHLPEMCETAKRAGKHLIFNAAGFSPEEDAELIELAVHGGAAGGELNKGCPNIWLPGEVQKPIMSYDPKSIQESLTLCAEVIGSRAFELWVKLSPIFDSVLLREVASVIGECPVATGITVVNTLPNCFLYGPDGNSVINPAFSDGLAGMSGPFLKGVGLGHIIQLRKMQTRGILPERIKLFGVGGIWSGQDVVDYLRAGASAVQVGTAVFEYGRAKLREIFTEYLGYMELSKLATPASL